MKDESKSKQQLLNELKKLRQRVSELDASETNHRKTLKALQKSHDKLEKKIEEQRKELEGINASNGTEYLTVEKAWDMLCEVPMEASLVYYSVVYEPEKGLLHFALSQNQNHAPDCEKVTLSIDDLLND